MQVSIGFSILGTDYYVSAEVKITERSSRPTYDDAGSGCEWELEDIELCEDMPGKLGPALEVPAWLRAIINESDALADAVSEAERELPRRRGRAD